MLDGLLRDVGQHGIRAAKGDNGHLAEKDRDPAERRLRPEHDQQSNDRN